MPWIVIADGKLEEVTLYPVSLNPDAERPGALGRPFLADEETAKKIIEKMRTLSSSYMVRRSLFRRELAELRLNRMHLFFRDGYNLFMDESCHGATHPPLKINCHNHGKNDTYDELINEYWTGGLNGL